MKRTLIVAVALVVVVLLVCFLVRPGKDAAAGGARPELVLYCGAGIRPAAEALIGAFESESPCRIVPTYAGSGQLLGQVATMSKGDLFMPGAELYVDRAIEKGLADGSTRRIVAYFVPVLFVAKGNPRNVRTLADLRQPGLRVGLGDERSCAVGQVTLEILKKNAIAYSAVEPNVVYKSGTVDELAEAVRLGSVDAVIVWNASARLYAAHGEAIPIPLDQNVISSIPIVVLKSSQHADESRRFVEFACSAQARQILDKLGYTTSLPGVEGAASDKEKTDR